MGRGTWILAAFLLTAALPLVVGAPAASADPVQFTLYGDALRGWGSSSGNITNPGPRLVVYLGDVVNLTLVGVDSALHNWFIDYDNDTIDDLEEPDSEDFLGTTITFEFTADRAGTWTYRCRVHPLSMTGTIEIRASGRPRNFTLNGDAVQGWGFNTTDISNPGPTVVVATGDNVTLTLVGADSALHNWFIDYDNDTIDDPEEPNSGDFMGTTIVFNFVPDRAGNWTYRCRVHPTTMTGRIEIRVGSSDGFRPPPPSLDPILTILLGTIAFVLLFSAGYHARAVRARRREK